MKAEELRIGNYFYLWDDETGQNKVHYVFEINEDELNGFKSRLRESEPIPLTKEWLLKFGFKKSSLIGFDGGWQHSNDSKYYIQQMSNAITIHLITEESVALLTGFHFVHQLQNLYFALTGEELNLK